MGRWPRTIEVGNGPDVEVHSQEEHDAFIAAARANGEAQARQGFTAMTVGDLLEAGFAVIVAHPDGQRRAAAFGDRTHPCSWEFRYHDDGAFKSLNARLTVEGAHHG